MGTGIGSEKIYQLIEECGGSEASSSLVLQELIKYLSRDTLEDFVSYFRRNHVMEEDDSEDTCEEDATDLFDLEQEDKDSSTRTRFFSSLIPEC